MGLLEPRQQYASSHNIYLFKGRMRESDPTLDNTRVIFLNQASIFSKLFFV